jgi:hypothetical protein
MQRSRAHHCLPTHSQIPRRSNRNCQTASLVVVAYYFVLIKELLLLPKDGTAGIEKISNRDQAKADIVTIRQVEAGATEPRRATLVVIRQAFERAGVEFIDENGGGPGVRLRKRPKAKTSRR